LLFTADAQRIAENQNQKIKTKEFTAKGATDAKEEHEQNL